MSKKDLSTEDNTISTNSPGGFDVPLSGTDSSVKNFNKVEDRYLPIRLFGEGGFGKVHYSFDSHLKRTVALKSMHRHPNEVTYLQAIISESRLMAYLDHPGVVSIYDVFINEDDNYCYSMKAIEGENLETWLGRYLEEHIFPPIPDCLLFFTRLCETLAYAHDKGVLHLDIKPENLMLGRYGEVYLVDWGSAFLFRPEIYGKYLKEFGLEEPWFEQSPKDNRVMGTPLFMSPEQTEVPRHELTPASDVFSAGVLLYRLLTGLFPFSTDNMARYMHDLHEASFTPVNQHRRGVSVRLSEICSKMLERDLDKRYSNFRDVLDDISDLFSSGRTFETRSYQKGEIIFSEGDPGEYAFQIVSGSVEVSASFGGENKLLATRTVGDVLGELSTLNSQPRTATITVIEPTTVTLMTKADIAREFDKLHPWVSELVQGLSQKFIELNQEVHSTEE